VVVLPSKHLETPAYDIERIKSVEGLEDKASHLHIKEDEISVPDFAKNVGRAYYLKVALLGQKFIASFDGFFPILEILILSWSPS